MLGNGMVIDPKAFFEEADRLTAQGIEVSPERVKISSRAHLIFPTTAHSTIPAKSDSVTRKLEQRCEVSVRLMRIRPVVEVFVLPMRLFLMFCAHESSEISKTPTASFRPMAARNLTPKRSSARCRALTERLGAFIGDTTHYLKCRGC